VQVQHWNSFGSRLNTDDQERRCDTHTQNSLHHFLTSCENHIIDVRRSEESKAAAIA